MARTPTYGGKSYSKPPKPKAPAKAPRKPRDDYSSGYTVGGGMASRPAAPRFSKRHFAG